MFGVDVGGTFTDVVAIKDGRAHVTKVPSTPDQPELAVLEGAKRLGVEGSPIFNHASTKGLNAVLTRSLPKVAFMTTDGHRDMLDAGRGWRPFDGMLNPHWRRPFGDASGRPLVPRYLRRGVVERVLANGDVLTPLDEDNVRRHLELLQRCNIDALAVCTLNSYVNPVHEFRIKELAQEVLGDIPISISYETVPRAKEYARASTTVIDAMMKLMYADYAGALSTGLTELGFEGDLNFADCTASLLPWDEALKHPYRIIFAGPAAGAASCVQLGKAVEAPNLICCDVGGTSTDVTLVRDGETFTNESFDLEFDLAVNALSTDVSSVGAGGGSIISVTSTGDIRVGPESAGSNPGPACYGRGGTVPTVTDACALMGILDPDDFAGGQMQLDLDAARRAFESLDTPLSFDQRVSYAYRVAVHNIAEEVANVAIARDADPRDFSLVAYGSAGPMLIAPALEILDVTSIIIPPNPGLFSALGLLSTDMVYGDSRSVYLPVSAETASSINEIYESLEAPLLAKVPAGVTPTVKRTMDGRLVGQSWETPFVDIPNGTIDEASIPTLVSNFHDEYERRNGLAFTEMPVQGVTYRVQVFVPMQRFEYTSSPDTPPTEPVPTGYRTVSYLREAAVDAPTYDRGALERGAKIIGPAIIEEELCTILVMQGQVATVGAFGEISLTKLQKGPGK